MADYKDAYEGTGFEYGGVKPKRLATEAIDDTDPNPVVKDMPEQWNTEWDDAYNLGLKHGIERERERWREKVQKWMRDLDFEV